MRLIASLFHDADSEIDKTSFPACLLHQRLHVPVRGERREPQRERAPRESRYATLDVK